MKKICSYVLSALILMSCFVLNGCENNICVDKVIVPIKIEYAEQFDNKEFSVYHFNYDNIDRIDYWTNYRQATG